MKVSFAILTHNEHDYIEKLIQWLLKYKQPQDEIVVVDDYSEGVTQAVLEEHAIEGNIHLFFNSLNNDFAKQKNFLIQQCTGDWIFNIDADEIPHYILLRDFRKILEVNPDVEAYRISRVNVVKGMTDSDAMRWRWTINERGWINWPDYQLRLFKNDYPRIKWVSPVHETLIGFKAMSHLPSKEEYSFLHEKTIERQTLQNEFYQRIQLQ